MSDTEVIRRILAGEEALFAQIVTRYSGYVWALCSSYVRNPSDCEDVAQEVFVQCYRRLDTLRNPAALGAWLSQLARRRCLMWLRTAQRRQRRESHYEIEREGNLSAHAAPARDELQHTLASAIDTLPPAYREALLLRFGEGYSIQQAAAFLGITPAAMRKRVERGQHLLKDLLWDQVEPALSQRKHHDHLAGAVVAAIPFGDAPWLHSATAGSAAATALSSGTQLAMIGGIVMGKKLAIGAVILAVVFGVAWIATQRADESKVPATDTSRTDPSPSFAGVSEAAGSTNVAAMPESEPSAATPDPAPQVEAAPVAPQPASVTGHIKEHDGTPIAGAEVLLEIATDGERDNVAKSYRATTGPDGAYRIAGIDVFDRGIVYASADGYTMAFDTLEIRKALMAEGIDLLLSPAAYYIAGYVRSQSRQPIAGASVDTMYYGYDEAGLAHTAETGQTTGNIGGIKLMFAITDDKGYFKLALPMDGLCDLRVVKEGYGPGFFPGILADTENADLVLRAGGAIAGRVSTAAGKPVSGLQVTAQGTVLPGGLKPSAVKVQELPAKPASATTDANGEYLLEGLGEDYLYSVVALGTSGNDLESLPTDRGLRTIARMMDDFNHDVFNAEDVAARKSDVHVKAGQTTRVDLKLGDTASGVIYGKVTDRTSGQPVCPVVVTAGDGAESGGLRAMMRSMHGGAAVTGLDGQFRLTIPNLASRVSFVVSHSFMTEGGSAWEQPEAIGATVDLGPGEEREVNLVVDAPVTVPVRYVNSDGSPREGVSAAMRAAGASGGCGGTLISDADGRVTFHGIRPGISLQAVAWLDAGNDLKTIGVSEPFEGQPGETVPEVIVTCHDNGGVAGAVRYPDGTPAAGTDILCVALLADGSMAPAEGALTTDANGAFELEDAFPENDYAMIAIGFIGGDPTLPYSVMIPGVQIAAGEITDLGTLTVAIEKDLSRVVQAVGYDRKANEAIAAIYSAEALSALNEPGLALKAGMALYDVGRYDEALGAFQQTARTAEGESIYTPIALIWQGQMLDLLGRRNEAVAIYESVAAMGTTDSIRHDQFGMDYNPSEYAQELMGRPFTRLENQY